MRGKGSYLSNYMRAWFAMCLPHLNFFHDPCALALRGLDDSLRLVMPLITAGMPDIACRAASPSSLEANLSSLDTTSQRGEMLAGSDDGRRSLALADVFAGCELFNLLTPCIRHTLQNMHRHQFALCTCMQRLPSHVGSA
eukprot:302265-Amphidinium_carterae.1